MPFFRISFNKDKFMIKLLFSSLLFISIAVYSQSTEIKTSKKTQKFIDEVSKIIKNNSIYTDSLNWKEIAAQITALPMSGNDSIDHSSVIQFFTKKLRQAGDKHSSFLTKRTTAILRNNLKDLQPTGLYLEDGIGMIKVPAYMTFEQAKDVEFANTIRTEIKKLDTSHNITGWVVDLRQNMGGNMWPMLAGLNALIKDGTVGYFVSSKSNKKAPWLSKSKANDYKIKNTNTKIAVLIDSLTASSGEMAAISFIGLPNVKVFGLPSAGYTTANQTFQLPDGIRLLLAAKYVADRTEKPYLDKILPDVVIDNNPNTTVDETVEISKKWLLQ
jgi:carboxyl-terminal processing protease